MDYNLSTEKIINKHKWTKKDDLIALLCYKYYNDKINIKKFSKKYKIPTNSFKMKIDNYAYLENKSKLSNISKQAKKIYERYNPKSKEYIEYLLENDIKAILRQNQFKVHQKVFETIEYTKKIVCPYGHSQNICQLYNKNEFNDIKYAKLFINKMKINDKILVVDRDYNYGLILEITSDIKTGPIEEIKIIRKKLCDHSPYIQTCHQCTSGFIKIFSTKYLIENFNEIIPYLNEDYVIENMWTLYRDIKIIDKINNSFYNTSKNNLQQSINTFDLDD